MQAARSMTLRENCHSDSEPVRLNYQFIFAMVLFGCIVALIIAAGCEYAAQIDAQALAVGAGGL